MLINDCQNISTTERILFPISLSCQSSKLLFQGIRLKMRKTVYETLSPYRPHNISSCTWYEGIIWQGKDRNVELLLREQHVWAGGGIIWPHRWNWWQAEFSGVNGVILANGNFSIIWSWTIILRWGSSRCLDFNFDLRRGVWLRWFHSLQLPSLQALVLLTFRERQRIEPFAVRNIKNYLWLILQICAPNCWSPGWEKPHNLAWTTNYFCH